MVMRTVGRLALGAAGLMALSAVAVISAPAPAHADSFAFGYSSGHYPRHYHHPRHYHRHRGYDARYVYVAPPPVYYYPPPRVVYAPAPPPVYYAPPPAVVYQQPQTLPGGPLQAAQNHCREYQSTTIVNNQQVQSFGTACLQPDGSWRIVR